jgi:hypothetical protein
MSILNRASDGHFNVLICLVRAIVKFGPMPRDQLLMSCGAASPAVDESKLTQTLNRWKELGLFSEGDRVSLGDPYRGQLGANADYAEIELPKCVRTIVFAERNNQRFWESEENKSADFTRALAWMLAQDVYALDTSNAEAIMGLERQQVTDTSRRFIQNDTRWQGLRLWMTYLGFAREDTQLRVDPTFAVRDALTAAFGDADTLSSAEFVAALGAQLPVLDGGVYRMKVEREAMIDRSWSRPAGGWLSTSLSRALRRLEFERFIAFDQRSDTAEGATLIGRNGSAWRQFTHVRLLKPGAAHA